MSIAAAKAIAVEFLICGFYVDTLGIAQVFEVEIADAAGVKLTEFRVHPTAVTPNLGFIPAGALPIYRAANARIRGRSGGAGAFVIGVSMLYTIG